VAGSVFFSSLAVLYRTMRTLNTMCWIARSVSCCFCCESTAPLLPAAGIGVEGAWGCGMQVDLFRSAAGDAGIPASRYEAFALDAAAPGAADSLKGDLLP